MNNLSAKRSISIVQEDTYSVSIHVCFFFVSVIVLKKNGAFEVLFEDVGNCTFDNDVFDVLNELTCN